MAWVEDFVYPLYLLLIGSGVLGVAVALITHLLEDRRKKREIEVERKRKELEIRVDLVSKMTEVIAHMMAIAELAVERKKKTFSQAEDDAHYEDIKKWFADGSVISAKLKSYSTDTGIAERWDDYSLMLRDYTRASRLYFFENRSKEVKENLEYSLDSIRKYFSDENDVNWDRLNATNYDDTLWRKVHGLIGERAEELINDILKLSIKPF